MQRAASSSNESREPNPEAIAWYVVQAEPDLWRIHIRTIKGLLASIDSTTRTGDRAEAIVRWAGMLFLGGLLAVSLALGIFIFEVTF